MFTNGLLKTSYQLDRTGPLPGTDCASIGIKKSIYHEIEELNVLYMYIYFCNFIYIYYIYIFFIIIIHEYFHIDASI